MAGAFLVAVVIAMILTRVFANMNEKAEQRAKLRAKSMLVENRVTPILVREAGDDAVASLAMILAWHGIAATVEDVRKAIYGDRTDLPSAQMILDAASSFGLRGRGVQLECKAHFYHLERPSIAHVLCTKGPFPRALTAQDAFMVVVESVSEESLSLVSPYAGRQTVPILEFMDYASGVFLLFDRG
jgi:ABC-type bacteriocin/lantibiotic exporter with double-glycine peptidase domain